MKKIDLSLVLKWWWMCQVDVDKEGRESGCARIRGSESTVLE